MNVTYDRLLAQERLILAAQETICEAMEQESVTRSELARRIGKTRGYVTQLLSGKRNLTMRTYADLMHALDRTAIVGMTEKQRDA